MEWLVGILKASIEGGSFKRLAVFIAGLAIPPLNKWLGINASTEEVVGVMVLIATYLAQSMFHSVQSKKIAAEAAAKVITVEDAAKVLAEVPKP